MVQCSNKFSVDRFKTGTWYWLSFFLRINLNGLHLNCNLFSIPGALQRAEMIVSELDTGFPKYIIKNTIKNFNTKKDELVIPLRLFDEKKQVIICLLFSSESEKYNAYFINKLVSFTIGKVKFNVVWNTQKVSRYSF